MDGQKILVDLWIDWCLMPTLAIFQPYRGINKVYYYLKKNIGKTNIQGIA